jgi:DNA polymerase III epsilon subunit-like protein
MKDIMIDLETLGTRSDAMIIQIGACYFDRETGEIGARFSANVDASEFSDKFTTDYKTIMWWFDQTNAARFSVSDLPQKLKDALISLHQFLDKKDVNIWCHATFDMPILLNAFRVVGLEFPIHFRNMRDIRTLVDLADHYSDSVRDGVHHNALDDAMFQAKYCSEAMQKLKNGN